MEAKTLFDEAFTGPPETFGPESYLTDSPSLLWRDKWTALSEPLSLGIQPRVG